MAHASDLASECTSHFGYSIPTHLLRLTGGGPESFDSIALFQLGELRRYIGVEPNHAFLEVGCGIGRGAIPLTEVLSKEGNYVGVDIARESIEWCSRNITAQYPNFKFFHFDVTDQLHNPAGKASSTAFSMPCAAESIDRVFLWSVFTHMMRSDIEHYLREFARVLKPGGKVLASWFIVDDEILKCARSVNLTPFDLRFEHEIETGCYINNPDYPMGAVAFTRDVIEQTVSLAGLRIENIIHGMWSGYYKSTAGQDITVLSKTRA